MTSSAWIMMLITWVVVTGFTAYFFIKVLLIPPDQEIEVNQPEPDTGTDKL